MYQVQRRIQEKITGGGGDLKMDWALKNDENQIMCWRCSPNNHSLLLSFS